MTIQEALQESLLLAIEYTLVQVLEEEVDAFVNASPYQRTVERRDYRNGRYERDPGKSMGVIEEVPVPRTRGGFWTELFERWKKRPLQAHYWYVFADGTYFIVIYDGRGEKCRFPWHGLEETRAGVAVLGIDSAGKHKILGFTIGDRENQKALEDLMDNLKERGVRQIDLWITDDGKAMINAIENKFATASRQLPALRETQNGERLGLSPQEATESDLS